MRYALIGLLFLILVLPATAQDTTYTVTWQRVIQDSLSGAHDTVVVDLGSNWKTINTYQISTYSTAADTFTVMVKDLAGNWTTAGLESKIVDAGTIEVNIITTTGYVKWSIWDRVFTSIRFVSEGTANAARTFFTLSMD